MVARTAVAVVLLLSLGGVLWWANGQAGGPAVTQGDHWVAVVGPAGEVLANGTVHARGTPLAVVQALAAEGGFHVEVEQRPLVGAGCTADYVIGIAGSRETSTGGWNYYTRAAGQNWTWRSVGASCYALSAGEQVEWCWVEGDVCKHHTA